MDWAVIWDSVYASRITRSVTFKRAGSWTGSAAVYDVDRTFQAGVNYRERGFDPVRGVLFSEDRLEIQIWLRDWFSRSVDGATNTELLQLVSDLKGQVNEASSEFYSRWVIDGANLKLDGHRFEHRPDGVVFSFIAILQAS